MSMPTVERVYETVLYAHDLAAARAFYHDILGLPLHQASDETLFLGLCLPDGAMLLLFDPDQASQPGRDVPSHGAIGQGHIAFAIRPDQYEACLDHLHHHAIAIEQEVRWPTGARSIYVRDPAGNSVEFVAGDLWQS